MILLDATIVVCFEESHITAFIERHLFKVKTRAIYVSNQNSYAVLCKVSCSCFDDKESFTAVVVIEFVALVDFVAKTIFLISICLCHFNGFCNSFSFGFAVVKILLVAFVVVKDFLQLIGACAFERILSFVGEFHKIAPDNF